MAADRFRSTHTYRDALGLYLAADNCVIRVDRRSGGRSNRASAMKIAILSCLVAAAALTTSAQTKSATLPVVEARGVLTGHVYCADTNQPARFAKVSLESVHSEAQAGSKAQHPPLTASFTGNGITSVDTGLDGTFTISKVKPGAYYVIVSKGGYVSPRSMFTEKELDAPTPSMREMIEHILPRVDIENGQTAHAEVRLERGAGLSGYIRYDDGSPAGEITVSLLHKDPSGKWVPLEGVGFRSAGWTNTDDLGHFRFASLLPDEYLVKASLSLSDSRETSMPGPNSSQMVVNMMTFHSQLPFYGSGTPHQADAKPVKLVSGTETAGQDMVLPISQLFRMTGRVLAGRNEHAVNAADIALISKDDGKELTRANVERDDGLFHFDFVPAGLYTLKVSNARDVVWEAERLATGAPPSPFPEKDKGRTVENFGNAEQPLTVSGDMLGVNVLVTPEANK